MKTVKVALTHAVDLSTKNLALKSQVIFKIAFFSKKA